jgi:hypothetical protein
MNTHLPDKKKLKKAIGAPYGIHYRTVGRAVQNSAKENTASDDEHCAICIDGRRQALAEQKIKQDIVPVEQRKTKDPFPEGVLGSPKPIPEPWSTASAPALKDIILLESGDDFVPVIQTSRVRRVVGD